MIYLGPRFHFGNKDPKAFLVSPNNVELKRRSPLVFYPPHSHDDHVPPEGDHLWMVGSKSRCAFGLLPCTQSSAFSVDLERKEWRWRKSFPNCFTLHLCRLQLCLEPLEELHHGGVGLKVSEVVVHPQQQHSSHFVPEDVTLKCWMHKKFDSLTILLQL